MGYTTEFDGAFNIAPPLDEKHNLFLTKLSKTRRMKRKTDPKYGVEGELFVDGGGSFGQEHDTTVIDYNSPPSTQPSLWCEWVPNTHGDKLVWNGNAKFEGYVEWLRYLLEKFFIPWGYNLNGKVVWSGEDDHDRGAMVLKDNALLIV